MASLAEVTDADHVLPLYRRAFPDEDLTGLVADLIGLCPENAVLSLGITRDDMIVGHIILTQCRLSGEPELSVGLLGPLAVDPDHQRQGLGSALIEDGLVALQARGAAAVCVLGDPAYYSRSGFSVERDIATPHPIPDQWREAWQSIWFKPDDCRAGTLIVPVPWDKPSLWA